MPVFTLTVTAQEATRIATAFGQYWNLGRPATEAEVKQFLIRQMNGVVIQQERRAQESALPPSADVVVV